MNKPIKNVIKKWGSEVWLVNNDQYCAKLLTVVPEHQCSLHFHKIKKESFYISSGQLDLMLYDWGTSEVHHVILNPGDVYTIDPMQAHSFKTLLKEPCSFLEISTHHEDEDSYRLSPSK
jgi:mannose-6-phosphate isomerase-like protein (cupin superfamily)